MLSTFKEELRDALYCRECVVRQHECILGARTSILPAVRDKYANIQYSCVATSNPPPCLPAALFL